MGRKKLPIWAVVAADVRMPRDGRYIEDLGRYYPLEEPARVELKDDRVMYWLEVGAQPTETVRSLLSKQGLLLGLHLQRKGASAEDISAAVSAHRQGRADKAQEAKKLTASERRRIALSQEAKQVAQREAKEAAARQKAAAEKKEVAERKAREEAELQAATVETAQEEG